MKKTVLFIILGLVTVFCICLGTIIHMGGVAKVFNKGYSISFEDYDEEAEPDEIVNGKYAISEKLDPFTSIRIDSRIMSITIEEGPEFAIEGAYNKTFLKPNISVSGNKLEIRQAQQKKKINTGSQSCKVTITVPSGTKLDNLNIDCNVGDIRLREFSAGDIDIDTNVGEIDIRRVEFDNIDCDTNVGEISINPVKDLDDYDISVSTDVGEVRVDGRSYKRSYNSHGKGTGKIRLDTNVGEINVK